MHADVVDLREFYLSPHGRVVRRILAARLRHIWPNCRGERILTLGYGTPLLRPLLPEAESLTAVMPAAQGVAYWPREGPNISCLANTGQLPLADGSIDRAILIHALEGDPEPRAMLEEIWRVLKSGGRLLLVAPNRRGLWAHSDRTPFGTGRPYSSFQIRETLRDQGFLVERVGHALYMPPSSARPVLSLADMFEKLGPKLFPGFGGLLVAEAGKQLYAPSLTRSRTVPHRLILPLAGPTPLPAG